MGIAQAGNVVLSEGHGLAWQGQPMAGLAARGAVVWRRPAAFSTDPQDYVDYAVTTGTTVQSQQFFQLTTTVPDTVIVIGALNNLDAAFSASGAGLTWNVRTRQTIPVGSPPAPRSIGYLWAHAPNPINNQQITVATSSSSYYALTAIAFKGLANPASPWQSGTGSVFTMDNPAATIAVTEARSLPIGLVRVGVVTDPPPALPWQQLNPEASPTFGGMPRMAGRVLAAPGNVTLAPPGTVQGGYLDALVL